jgi:hypothetical protein
MVRALGSRCFVVGKRFDSDRLSQRLAPHGFAHNLPQLIKGGVPQEVLKGRISFVRRSSVERFYEHVHIQAGKVAWAEAVISAASFTSCHPCVSEHDGRLRAFLSGDSQFQTTRLATWAEAKAWQERLVENADSYCKRLAAGKGPVLTRRLEPVFAAVDLYVRALGDIFAVFDREFGFLAETQSEEQTEVNRLASLARSMLYLNYEDATLASLTMVRFGAEVEQCASPFQEKAPHRDAGLAARLVLLTDYIRAKRLEYEAAGGLCR